jgi:hypothetical protein
VRTKTKNSDFPARRAETLKKRAVPYFGLAAGVWIVISLFFCIKVTTDAVALKRAVVWFAVLGGICLLDLFALAQALAGLFDLMQGESENPTRSPLFLVIRTSYWGAIKLVCVIFLGFLMVKGARGSRIPTVGLLTGVSTLVAVPILGFIFWQRALRAYLDE